MRRLHGNMLAPEVEPARDETAGAEDAEQLAAAAADEDYKSAGQGGTGERMGTVQMCMSPAMQNEFSCDRYSMHYTSPAFWVL